MLLYQYGSSRTVILSAIGLTAHVSYTCAGTRAVRYARARCKVRTLQRDLDLIANLMYTVVVGNYATAKRWMFDNFISVLEWPPYSPDLNPIENLGGIFVRSVYAHQKQFNDVDSLSKCIRDAWDEINKDALDAWVRPMQKSCVEVVLAKGKKIDY